jgi:adenine-specific DNA-methyltransferase
VIKYIGSKRRLVTRIVALVDAMPETRKTKSVLDLFTGTTRVAQGLKAAGYAVTANDIASYSEVLAKTYIETDAATVDYAALGRLLARLNALPGVRGYFTETFCESARYLQPGNGMRVDAIRDALNRMRDEKLRTIALTSLLEAADRVDSTTGVQMAYLKQWSPRSHRKLELREPALLPGTGRVLRLDAREAAAAAGAHDVVYLDPPYNQHSYFGNYHVWETLVRGDAPPAYGVARKREDVKITKSAFNARSTSWEAFQEVVRTVDARHAIVSFNDEGYFELDQIDSLLRARWGSVAAIPVRQRRYIGAKIGIHDPRGKVVGVAGPVRNTEWLFVAGRDAAATVKRAEAAIEAEEERVR